MPTRPSSSRLTRSAVLVATEHAASDSVGANDDATVVVGTDAAPERAAGADSFERRVRTKLAPGLLGAIPWSAIFPDFANDGRVVNPATGAAREFSLTALRESVYVPPGAKGRAPLLFVEGANQWLEVGGTRARRHADRLGLPMAVVHNPSFVREVGAQPRPLKSLHRMLEGASNLVLHGGHFTERAAINLAYAMVDALQRNEPTYFAGESQGSILVGHALRNAHDAWVGARTPVIGAEAAEREFQERASASLFVLTFGNAWPSYPEGPNYLHLSIEGDPVPKDGSRPDNRPASDRRRYLIFERLFPGKDNFENHNIAFLNELFARTCELNGIAPGDLGRVFKLVQRGSDGTGQPLRIATAADVAWPDDMVEQLWDPARNQATVEGWALTST
ncbi:MAG: hypothetical protein IT383_26735 [Deltaproteobacteria bacterium]|nr:hypothetical protein [Deltaproteobacteria bacterium]